MVLPISPKIPVKGKFVFLKGEKEMAEEASRAKQNLTGPINLDDNFAQKKRLFSAAAQAFLNYRLNGEVKINSYDIRLEMEGGYGGAIFIAEQISRNPNFQKLLTETSCINDLKKLARKAIGDIL